MHHATVTINWTDRRDRDCDCDVDVNFEIRPGGFQDAEDDIRITSSRTIGECDLEQWQFEELLYAALEDHICANYDDYMESN